MAFAFALSLCSTRRILVYINVLSKACNRSPFTPLPSISRVLVFADRLRAAMPLLVCLVSCSPPVDRFLPLSFVSSLLLTLIAAIKTTVACASNLWSLSVSYHKAYYMPYGLLWDMIKITADHRPSAGPNLIPSPRSQDHEICQS